MVFRSEIEHKLLPLFLSKKCVILDVPAYPNVGDQLIWAGMEDFFRSNKIDCVYRSSCHTFTYREFTTDTIICLVGGGNFGDLWRGLQEFKNRIVQLYPNNKIVIFPQSVYYSDISLCNFDSKIFAQHNGIYICARDVESFVFLQQHFKNEVLLVPDMVLYLLFDRSVEGIKHKKLFLQRDDKEMVDYTKWLNDDMVVCDWPTHKTIDKIRIDAFMKRNKWAHRIFRLGVQYIKNVALLKYFYKGCSFRLFCRINDNKRSISERWEMIYMEINYLLYLNKKYLGRLNEIINKLLHIYHLPLIHQYAIEFMQDYDEVYTTRLHGGILAMMLGKKVRLVDNNYGKISALYRTWLLNEPNIEMID